MRIAILGGTGQIGGMITDHIVHAFPTAQILSCSRSGGENPWNKKFNVAQEDWSELGKLDVLVNCVGIIEEKGENTFQSIHVDLVKRIIQERELLGNPKLIQISALGADANSPSRYASSKGVADEVLQKQDNWNIIRPSVVCTPGTAIVDKVLMLAKMAKLQLGLLPIPSHFLKAKFQPVMGEDVAQTVVECIKQDVRNKLIYATGPKLSTLGDWVKIARKGKVSFIKLPKWLVHFPFQIIITLFPSLMNKDQYLLLGIDNTHENSMMTSILKREPLSTDEFWQRELSA